MQQLLLLEEVIKNKDKEIVQACHELELDKKQLVYSRRYLSTFMNTEHLAESVKKKQEYVDMLTAEIEKTKDRIKELEEHKRLWINVLKSVKCAYEFRNLSKTLTPWRIFTLESAKEMSPRLREFLNVNAEE